MADYQAPLRDMRFVLNEVFEVSKLWTQLPALAEVVDEETASAILEEAGKVTAGIIAPLNRSGDEEGCSWDNGAVKTPAGFPEAYQTYAAGGWVGVGGDPQFGGMGMPKAISAQVEEMVNSANLSFGLYPMLTAGACLSINAPPPEKLKEKKPPLVKNYGPLSSRICSPVSGWVPYTRRKPMPVPAWGLPAPRPSLRRTAPTRSAAPRSSSPAASTT